MIIKKYQAKTEEDAVKLAKKELGEDVVIMNVKSIKPKGLFSFFKSTVVEVTVAKEEEEEIQARNEANSIREAVNSVNKLRSEAEAASKPNDNVENTGNDSKELEKKVDTIHNLLEKKLFKTENEKATKETAVSTEGVKSNNDNSNLKDMPDSETISFMKLLYNTMVENEVSQQYANQMVEEIEQNYSKNMQMEDILAHIYQKMILKFGKVEGITPSKNKKPKVVFFIGPTGVGKTTTLAKIASNLCIIESKKVAMFTADTYRIAAKDQLNTYANILDIPFEVIYENENGEKEDVNFFSSRMEDAYNKYSDYDFILVDTAGHSHHNDEQRDKMNNFIHSLDDKAETEVYLVLSATTKAKDLISIADTYSKFSNYKLIFTKLDETTTYGNMLNIRVHTGAPMSYVTCGQNVPNDIDKFDPQDIVRKLLGGNA